MNSFKSGYVAILGQPNVGKSTLMNCFLGQKLSIVSSKPGTTRDKIIGVLHRPEGQIIFIDTPGLHKPRTALGDHMLKEARSSFDEADLILVMMDVQSDFFHLMMQVEQILKTLNKKIFLVINKVDLVSKAKVLPVMDQAIKTGLFHEIIPISCKENLQLDRLLELIIQNLPEGQKFYADDQITDRTQMFLAGETVREKALHYLDEEVPHSVAIKIEEMTHKSEKNIWMIQATVYVEKSSQKAILIGKKGSMLKKIGEESRRELENQLGCKVYLGLWVKVLKDWKKDERRLVELGYQFSG